MKKIIILLSVLVSLFLLTGCECKHTNAVFTVTKAVTCETDGLEEADCPKCNAHLERVVSAEGHQIKVTEGVEPTCTSEGITEKQECTICGKVFQTQNAIAKLPHNYVEKIEKEATCTESGIRVYTCSMCGDSYNETIKALGHSYQESIIKVASCTEDGLKESKCSLCGDTFNTVIPSKGHSYKTTSNGDGTHTAVCSNCGLTSHSDCEMIASFGDDAKHTQYKCSICGNSYIEDSSAMKLTSSSENYSADSIIKDVSVYVKKIGTDYQFTFYFTAVAGNESTKIRTVLFPAGLGAYGSDTKGVKGNGATTTADVGFVSFILSYDYIFNNPVNTNSLYMRIINSSANPLVQYWEMQIKTSTLKGI